MTRDATPDPIAAASATERRRHARFKQKSLFSNLGPVIDLSRSGLRVLSTRRRRGIQKITIFDQSGRRLVLRARVVWSKRVAFRKHVIGLELVDCNDDVARELTRMGTTGLLEQD